MADLNLLKNVCIKTPSKMVMLVFDGLGGLPHPETGKTELETAVKPNLDRLASEGICGLQDPVAPGITPGSGPGHFSLFGYDPAAFLVGRGVLEALGVDFDLQKGDVAARGNYCTMDEQGIVTDRRAGRIPTEKNAELCEKLKQIRIEGIEVRVLPGREHRFAVVFRGGGLGGDVTDTDPQKVGAIPHPAEALAPGSERTAVAVNEFVARAKVLLSDSHPANMILFRGISQRPDLPEMSEVFRLNPAAIATYPMYRGLARLVGMTILDAGDTFSDQLERLSSDWEKYDFFFVHFKHTDSAGEDGDFKRKARVIEEADALLPKLVALKPDVLIVTGDHSTPSLLKNHSWHPVPILLHSACCRTDSVKSFSEVACLSGGLGRIHGTDIMPLAMANALKTIKFGA